MGSALIDCTKLGDFSYSWLKVPRFQAGGIIRLNGSGISSINWLFIQEIRCIGATLGLWKGFQARSYMYMYERNAFPESKTLQSW